MTPEAQRIAIVEACPTVFVRPIGHSGWNYRHPNGRIMPCIDGDPLKSLEAMHAAEQTLKPCRVSKGGEYPEESQQWGNYVLKLLKTCEAHGVSPCHASAAHRAESFLRCMGKWVE